MNRILVFIFLLFTSLSFAQSTTAVDSMVRQYSLRAANYLDRDHVLTNNYSIDKTGVTIYRDSVSAMHVPEFFVAWNELGTFRNMVKLLPKDSVIHIMQRKGMKPFTAQQNSDFAFGKLPVKSNAKDVRLPLKGMKIAIDPGHTAADTAEGRIEDKYVDFVLHASAMNDTALSINMKSGDSVHIHLVEGELTWYVANRLANDLRRQGATVLLTRRDSGITAFGKTFQQWKKDDYPRTLDSLLKLNPADRNLLKLKSGTKKDDRFIFHYVFRDAELRKRAEIINAFHPNLTVVIHFNVDEKNKDWTKPTDKDFCMAFVGGSFQKGELDEVESRFDFLRLLLTNDLNQSISASSCAANSFTRTLNVPLAKTADATYLQEHCVYTGKNGVFCRNLSLTRMVEGPLIYGETLYQDNFWECLKLSPSAIGDPAAYPRLDGVEQAYYNAILEWFKSMPD